MASQHRGGNRKCLRCEQRSSLDASWMKGLFIFLTGYFNVSLKRNMMMIQKRCNKLLARKHIIDFQKNKSLLKSVGGALVSH